MQTLKADRKGTDAEYRRAYYGWQRNMPKGRQCSDCRNFDDITKKSYCRSLQCETLKTSGCEKHR